MYLIAIELANLLLDRCKRGLTLSAAVSLNKFLCDNYGKNDVSLDEILRPQLLKMSSISFEPQILGNKLGSISLIRNPSDISFGVELRSLTKLLMNACIELAKYNNIQKILVHFDELDRGLSQIDNVRSSMLTGLVLAADTITRELTEANIELRTIVYLRTDIWDDLKFADKNKIAQSRSIILEWDEQSLRKLIDIRIKAQLGNNSSWDTITTSRLMRGSQSKWNHIVARTFRRPRDVISFLNAILDEVKRRAELPLEIDNEDIVKARIRYSRYLKQELDDEIGPHWAEWETALQACSTIRTITFDRDQFSSVYSERFSKSSRVDAEAALSILYRFSVIGYEKRSGYGGSTWVFNYINPEAGWDNSASRFKVHLGLKEYAKLREDRQSGWEYDSFNSDDWNDDAQHESS